jgi:hypothetical protein
MTAVAAGAVDAGARVADADRVAVALVTGTAGDPSGKSSLLLLKLVVRLLPLWLKLPSQLTYFCASALPSVLLPN